jgi:hypothetical protein
VHPDGKALRRLLQIDFEAESPIRAGRALARTGAVRALSGVLADVPGVNNFGRGAVGYEIHSKKDIKIGLDLGIETVMVETLRGES